MLLKNIDLIYYSIRTQLKLNFPSFFLFVLFFLFLLSISTIPVCLSSVKYFHIRHSMKSSERKGKKQKHFPIF